MAKGNDGCDRTGASMMSSTIIPSANPPAKHMPTAPTPGPPTSACRLRANARSQAMIGDVCFNAIVVNSLDTHTFSIGPTPYTPVRRLAGNADERRHDHGEAGLDHLVGELRRRAA